eukprot:CAMPEP_0119029340 /NCGR_PEP_ID=MMETSP1176-20130426/40466_1 /TAXON_ID=265551 /ORGANISM="Synedropsis recta cf, Strain CCMP1620" /LENGTH=928 /DNA_ID=CAMNT_0006985675 /DNA_START=82 /DNA_END=2868 /DNA_ORIENTATION=-
MKFYNLNAAIIAAVLTMAEADNTDRFNYDKTRGSDFGPDDWKKVECDDPGRCEGFPDPWETAIGWDLEGKNCFEVCTNNDVKNNNCKSCPAGGPSCGQHRQSPIDLMRDRGLFNHENEKECPDWHWMKYQDGACTWDDLVDNDDSIHRNNFLIQRHALQILQPVDNNGNLECFDEALGGARYPRLDYSKGFPDWWHLAHTEVSVPSEHTQEGKRYDAEVTLAHFYEVDDDATRKNEIGKVVVFLEAFDNIEAWPMLDKLICQWRETEEKTRDDCDLDSVSTYYPGCTNYARGHTPAPVDAASGSPSLAPITEAPITPIPTTSRPTPAAPFVTQAPVMPTMPVTPRPAGTLGMSFDFNPCNICGADNLRITNDTAVILIPAFPPMTCREFENAGAFGLIEVGFCPIFPAFVGACKCEEILLDPATIASAPVNTLAPDTTAPVTTAPVTTAPVTTAPIAVAETSAPIAPSTSAPIVPSTSAPVTAAPSGSSAPSSEPSSEPSKTPIALSSLTSLAPSAGIPVTSSEGGPVPSRPTVPAPFECPTFSDVDHGIDVNYRRMCKENSCCDGDVRSATNFCHDAYSFFDDLMPAVCLSCCEEPKIIAPAPAPHPEFNKIDCAEVENPRRICKPDKTTSCCGERSDTRYCEEVYRLFPGDLINSVCWYCCETPLEVEPATDEGNRLLRSESNIGARKAELAVDEKLPKERELKLLKALSLTEDSEQANEERVTALRHSNADARMHHFNVAPENKVVDNIDDDEYFKTIWDRHLQNEDVVRDEDERERRRLVNYEDVDYWPYEWLLKVKTEYYFRYEGTQAVPPCKDQVHWRVMKDPIPIARRQLEELERLMGQRIAAEDAPRNKCKPDHAGKLREGTTDKFDFARPVQEFHKLHRKVFCECKDWKSKFDEDRFWCDKNIFDRFYMHPYNYNSTEF